uniref:Sushi domain containing 2 n=1 Tax=Nothobranchius furzeri TaxID=105023 RepID=A0A8C6NX41_NOTFU
MNANVRKLLFLFGILFFSPQTSGQTCRKRCGQLSEECSCHASCLSLLTCCTDHNQFCLHVSPHSSSMLGGRALRILGSVLPADTLLLCRFVKGETKNSSENLSWIYNQRVGVPGPEGYQGPTLEPGLGLGPVCERLVAGLSPMGPSPNRIHGLIQLRVLLRNVQGLWSSAHILAWHLEQASSAWARDRCLQWDALESKLPNFLDKLMDCPCTLAQARADSGRFHTDYTCDIERGSVCTYHPGSVHCVRSVQASPSDGSGQQCCYDSVGDLVLTWDSVGGSTPDRAHDWGAPPYRTPPRIPGYSHWLYDVTSFFYCCLWSDLCHLYLNRRPSSGCRNYRPPRAAAVLGSLHFRTFDGLRYTFSGRGEYDLVRSPHRALSVQVRAERVKLENGTLVRATRLASVAMRENSSDVIEVRLQGEHLQVLRNKSILPFSEQSWMDLQGVFVFVPSPQNVTVMFSSGAAVELRLDEGTMTSTVLLPAEFSNKTRGLLGQMNSNPSDDLVTPAGNVASSANATLEEIFTIASEWNISKASSLFTYDSRYLLDSYFLPPSHDSAFVPAFSLPEKPDDPLVADMLSVCLGEGAQLCKHDTLITRSLAGGNATLRALRSHRALMEALEPVASCGWLPAPRNGKKNGTRYLQGSTLSFTCNGGYVLYGSTERTCEEKRAWSGLQTHCKHLATFGGLMPLRAAATRWQYFCTISAGSMNKVSEAGLNQLCAFGCFFFFAFLHVWVTVISSEGRPLGLRSTPSCIHLWPSAHPVLVRAANRDFLVLIGAELTFK